MSIKPSVTSTLAALIAITATQAQTTGLPAVPRYGSSYGEIKVYHNKALDLSSSPAERVAILKNTIRSRYGEKGLKNLFGGMEGLSGIDPDISGVSKNILLATTENLSQRKGYVRQHLYATKIYNDPRLKLLSVNERSEGVTRWTDKDLRFRQRGIGATWRIEVKDVTLESQKADIRRLKQQIFEMGVECKRTGELQAIVNRKPVHPELKMFAERNGVLVYENVVTGEQSGNRPGNTRIEYVIEDMVIRGKCESIRRTLGGGTAVAFSAMMLRHSVPHLLSDLRALNDPRLDTATTRLRLGRDSSLAISGIAGLAGGGSQLLTLATSNARILRVLTRTTHWGSALATASFLVSEGFVVAEWSAGSLSTRAFFQEQAHLVGGLGGTLAGGYAGGKLGALGGSLLGPWGTAIGGVGGTLVGGIAGYYGGSKVGTYAAGTYYRFKDEQQEQALRNFMYAYYGVSQ